MDRAPRAVVRVALLAEGPERTGFRAVLESEGMEVVVEGSSIVSLPSVWNGADVLLLGMHDQLDPGQIQQLLQQSPVPVLLNRGGIGNTEIWQRRLVSKLRVLADRGLPPEADGRGAVLAYEPELRVVQDGTSEQPVSPWLVVLGASLGGPKAVARFLQALRLELPVAFLLVQHISESCQDLLVEQLNRCSRWPVAMLGEEQTVVAGHVWMVPANHRIEIEGRGALRRSRGNWGSTHRPDINAVLRMVAESFGAQCGAMMFSGLGKDGTQGCEAVASRGGFVWVQSSESCVISNMPEATRRCCKVEYSGSPEQLAMALMRRCGVRSTEFNEIDTRLLV